MSNNTPDMSAFDAVFDRQLEDLAELPSYTPPPTGSYNLAISVGMKVVNKKPAVEASFKVRDIVEVADAAEAEQVKPGQEFSILFILRKDDGSANEFAEGKMREFLGELAPHFNTNNIKDLVGGMVKEWEATATVKRKVNRKDADRFDVDVKDIVPLA